MLVPTPRRGHPARMITVVTDVTARATRSFTLHHRCGRTTHSWRKSSCPTGGDPARQALYHTLNPAIAVVLRDRPLALSASPLFQLVISTPLGDLVISTLLGYGSKL